MKATPASATLTDSSNPSSGFGTAEATVGPVMVQGAGPTASNTLANTGAETSKFLRIGGMALLLGVALCVAGWALGSKKEH